jgi:L-alanine-DL-glutamate epimerase-like enolase superfamily enzyme
VKINKVNIYKLLLPFAEEFAHSLRKRTFVNNIIVEIVTDQKEITGYGEGAPRSYVTGETQGSAAESVKFLIEQYPFPWQLNDVNQIWDFVDNLPDEKNHNSAICALEMALLDSLAKENSESVLKYFPDNFYTNSVYYGAAIPIGSQKIVMQVCRTIRGIGIKKLKLKVGKNFEQNRVALSTLAMVFEDDYDLKVDINGVWDNEIAIEHIPMLREYDVRVVEQPMAPDDPGIAQFAEAIKEDSISLMADESACSLGDVKKLVKDNYYNLINVRLSKCGGFRRSLQMIDYLRDKGVSFQIGCQLGETGLLSAAGRALSLLCEDAVYYDGSYDQWLLKENITLENVSFGPGGKAGRLRGPGLGVQVSKQKLEGLSDLSSMIQISR